MKTNLGIAFATLVIGLLIILIHPEATHAQNGSKPGHVSGAALPASYAAPAVLEGGTTNTNLDVLQLVLVNNTGSTQTVSIETGDATPIVFFSAVTIPANGSPNSVWTIPTGGIRFTGGMKWQASSTSVVGWIVGSR